MTRGKDHLVEVLQREGLRYKFKKVVYNQVASKFPKARDDRVSKPKPTKGKGTSSTTEKPTCGKCGKKIQW